MAEGVPSPLPLITLPPPPPLPSLPVLPPPGPPPPGPPRVLLLLLDWALPFDDKPPALGFGLAEIRDRPLPALCLVALLPPEVRAFSRSSQCERYGSGNFRSSGNPGCMRERASNAIEWRASVASSKPPFGINIRSLSVPGFLGSCNITLWRCLPSGDLSYAYFGLGRF